MREASGRAQQEKEGGTGLPLLPSERRRKYKQECPSLETKERGKHLFPAKLALGVR